MDVIKDSGYAGDQVVYCTDLPLYLMCMRRTLLTLNFRYADASFHELYNLDTDPFQLTNLWDATSPSEQKMLVAQLREAWACKGSTCRHLTINITLPTS